MLPRLITRVPGPGSRRLARELSRVESPNVTFLGPPGPVFWRRAAGCNVWDVDGNRYLDLTSAFGVASLGHTISRVRTAISRQASRLMHGMGDVYPADIKVELLSVLSEITFGRWTNGRIRAQSVLGQSGFEAVEIAMKTARLKTGRSRIVAFEGGYHGTGYGALQATWRMDFRKPFADQLRELASFLPYPRTLPALEKLKPRLRRLLGTRRFGAVIVEPFQGRGGIVCPPREFLRELRKACDRTGTLLVADEIFTGFWRTGRMFGVEHSGVVPDIICLGKALTGVLPLSACVGKAGVMRAWPRSKGEAIHTTTFLGNPLACAAALASIRAFRSATWKGRLAAKGNFLSRALGRLRKPLRVSGIGLMHGLELRRGQAIQACRKLLERGILALPEGDDSEVLSLVPPLSISATELQFATHHIRQVLDEST